MCPVNRENKLEKLSCSVEKNNQAVQRSMCHEVFVFLLFVPYFKGKEGGMKL